MKNLDFKRITFVFAIMLMLPLSMSAGLRGDVNKDGFVNVADVTALISNILSGEPWIGRVAADVNFDNQVNVADVTFLIRLILDNSSTDLVRTFTVNGVTFRMIRVEAGTFTMGATPEQGSDAAENEKPAHQVTLTKSYYICETEVTQELWDAVVDYNNSYFRDPQTPVNMVTYSDCSSFCTNLSSLTGVAFRLPTEAEWEFAARGGNLSRGYKYAGSNDIDEVAWYRDNSGDILHPVGLKAPNELGLYDMSGNAIEWVQDRLNFKNNPYPSEPQTDPCVIVLFDSGQVVRGGSYQYYKYNCRVSSRMSTDWMSSECSFRMVFEATE